MCVCIHTVGYAPNDDVFHISFIFINIKLTINCNNGRAVGNTISCVIILIYVDVVCVRELAHFASFNGHNDAVVRVS